MVHPLLSTRDQMMADLIATKMVEKLGPVIADALYQRDLRLWRDAQKAKSVESESKPEELHSS